MKPTAPKPADFVISHLFCCPIEIAGGLLFWSFGATGYNHSSLLRLAATWSPSSVANSAKAIYSCCVTVDVWIVWLYYRDDVWTPASEVMVSALWTRGCAIAAGAYSLFLLHSSILGSPSILWHYLGTISVSASSTGPIVHPCSGMNVPRQSNDDDEES